MKYDRFISKVSKRAGYTKRVTRKVVNGFVDEIISLAKNKDEITIKGFGKFLLVSREPRAYYHMKSGECRKSPRKKFVGFRPSRKLIFVDEEKK